MTCYKIAIDSSRCLFYLDVCLIFTHFHLKAWAICSHRKECVKFLCILWRTEEIIFQRERVLFKLIQNLVCHRHLVLIKCTDNIIDHSTCIFEYSRVVSATSSWWIHKHICVHCIVQIRFTTSWCSFIFKVTTLVFPKIDFLQ